MVPAPPGQGTAPAGAPTVARISSPPMRDLVGEMLRESDNMTAELLVKELGRRFAGAGTTVAGVGVVRAALAAAGLPVARLQTVDGSGLDRSDRASCSLLLAGLDHTGRTGPVASGFPVAARDGTLARRFLGTPAAGRLQDKTGALDGVVGLTGYVERAGGQDPLVFSLLANDLPRDAVGRALQDRLGTVLARYPDAPPPDTLGP
jgi:D-alanyl-D-alanine carboxypeptidase/D-alanyl-D-alanine-endopeptidase (penicillin-binding protein 4)